MRSLRGTCIAALAAATTFFAAPAVASACTPSATHPQPVVLVHGTFANQTNSWLPMKAALAANGFCAYSFNYGAYAGSAALGIYGTGPIETSAQQLKVFVDDVLRRTGARKVDIVGHSQGGMMPRYYLKNLGGAAKVDDLVGLSPSNHGTSNPFAIPAGVVCPACAQQYTGSSFLRALNAGDETPGSVDYTVIATRYDEVVLPYTSGFLNGARNITLQDVNRFDLAEHLGILFSPTAIRLVRENL